MQYDRLLQRLQTLRERYETDIRQLLAEQSATDSKVADAILHKPAKQPPKSASPWTPARRAKQSRIMKHRMRAKYGKAK